MNIGHSITVSPELFEEILSNDNYDRILRDMANAFFGREDITFTVNDYVDDSCSSIIIQ